MLAAIVRASLRNPRIVTALACLIAALGLAALLAARFDVFPGLRAAARAGANRGARASTRPRSRRWSRGRSKALLAGTENVKTVRSTSSQGLSAIQVVFDRGGDPYRQRQVVTERLAEFAGLLPQGVGAPLLSPLSSSMEYLVHFGYTSDRLSPRGIARCGAMDRQAADSRRSRRGAGADLRRRGARAADRSRSGASSRRPGSLWTMSWRPRSARPALIGGGYLETPTQRIVIQAQAPGATLEALGQAVVGTRAGHAGAPRGCRHVARRRRAALRRCVDRRQAGHTHRNLDAVRRQHARSHARARGAARCARAGARQAGSASTIRRCCGRRVSSKARSRNCATRWLIGAVLVVALLLRHPARLARRVGLLQRDPARAADDGVDSRGVWAEPQHHDARRSGRRARRGGRRCRHRRGEHSAPPPRRGPAMRTSASCSSARRSRCAGRCSTRPPPWRWRSCPS